MTQRTLNFVSVIGGNAVGLPDSDRVVYVGGNTFSSVQVVRIVLGKVVKLTPQHYDDIDWAIQVWTPDIAGRPIAVIKGQGIPTFDHLSALVEAADRYMDSGIMQDLRNPLH